MRRKHDFPARAADLVLAPGDLGIVQAFVNTRDLEHRTDELKSPEALADWLERRRLLPAGAELTAANVRLAAEVREALRAVLVPNSMESWPTGGPAERAVELLDRIAATAPIVVRFSGACEARFEPGDRVFLSALGRIFSIVAAARLEDEWRRLKVCVNGECRAAFYDASPNRSGRWCHMRRCGNRIKGLASERRRQRAAKRRKEYLRAEEARKWAEIDARRRRETLPSPTRKL